MSSSQTAVLGFGMLPASTGSSLADEQLQHAAGTAVCSPACSSLPAFRALLQIRAVRKKPGALSPVSFSPVLAQSVDHDEHSVSITHRPVHTTCVLLSAWAGSVCAPCLASCAFWRAGTFPSWVSYVKVQKFGRLRAPGWANMGDSLTCTHACVAVRSDEVPWHWDSQKGCFEIRVRQAAE